MVPEKYISAYKNFVELELSLTAKYKGEAYASKLAPYYQKMYSHIAANATDYVIFEHAPVKFYELEFAESVVPIREKLLEMAATKDIPMQVLFLPRVKIAGDKWDSIIYTGVVKLIRELYDENPELEFETLRNYRACHRSSKMYFWTESAAGKQVMTEIATRTGLKKKDLVVKQLKLFDYEFVKQQMQWMSREIWIHKELATAYEQLHFKKTKPSQK